MRWLTAVLVLWILLSAAPLSAGETPLEIAGFALGADIGGLAGRLQMDTVLPVRYQEYLEEVEIAPLPGFKSGLIAYGTCAAPGRIVRVKLKYIDASRAFYDALLARVERRFGKPSAYEGDPFHIVVEWKWSFVDAQGNRISLHLSHNNQDIEEKYGNAVKLTRMSAIEEERACHMRKHPREKQGKGYRRVPLTSMTQEDWQRFLPR
jgi:hypothetical protein